MARYTVPKRIITDQKAYWRLWRFTRAPKDREAAIKDGQRAAGEYYDDFANLDRRHLII